MTESDDFRAFAQALFADPDAQNESPPAGDEDPTPGNVVPGEGTTTSNSTGDAEMREFISDLFEDTY